jgi:hypothetical protein
MVAHEWFRSLCFRAGAASVLLIFHLVKSRFSKLSYDGFTVGEMAISCGVNNNSMSGALIAFGPLYLMLKAGPYAYSEEDEPCEALWHPWKYVYSPLDSGHRKVWTLG